MEIDRKSNSPQHILIFLCDMLFAAKIQEVANAKAFKVKAVRKIDDFKLQLAELNPVLVVINFDMPDGLAIKAFEALKDRRVQAIYYYPHVKAELFEQAQTLGIVEIYPRSKVIQKFTSILDVLSE